MVKTYDRADAGKEIAAVEAALRAGHPATSPRGDTTKKSAVRAAAEALGIDTTSLRHRVGTPSKGGAYWRALRLRVDWTVPSAAPGVEQGSKSVKDRRVTALEDDIRTLRKALRDAHREANTADVIREIVGEIHDTPRELPRWVVQPPERQKHKPTPEVPVTIWSDWHLGEVVSAAEVGGVNAYNMAIAEERVERLVETTIRLCRHNHVGVYPGAVVNLLGDCVSGGLHPELKATDEEEVIPASIKAIDWTIAALTRMLSEFGRLYVPCAAGNHGRGTPKPEFKRYYKKNFDWLIYSIVRKHFADDARIQFDVRPSNDVHYRVFGERYYACHADMLGVKGGDGIIGSIGPITRGEVKKSGQQSSVGMAFDKLLGGHWHQRLWLPRAIINNTLKGFDEYAKNGLGAKPDRPTQALWFVHPAHGQTAHWDVYVDDKPAVQADWVSWRDGAAA